MESTINAEPASVVSRQGMNGSCLISIYVKPPRGGERPGRPRRPEKFGRPIAIGWLRMKGNLAISEY